jgi:hypothetical protein
MLFALGGVGLAGLVNLRYFSNLKAVFGNG